MENFTEWVQIVVLFFQIVFYVIFAWSLYAVVITLAWAYSHMLLIVSCLGFGYCFYRVIRSLRPRHSYLNDRTVLKSLE